MEDSTEIDLATNDLGPLAWVLDELRKSLDSASAALRRFVRDTALARGSDMASVDGGHLRIARQQLHQAVGALEMVGLGAPAHMLRCMEAAVQKFVEKPELCNEAASAKVERAGFALTEYLEGVLLGKPASAVALFPQYRDVQELAGADRIHPADLWGMEWRWNDPATPAVGEAQGVRPGRALAHGPVRAEGGEDRRRAGRQRALPGQPVARGHAGGAPAQDFLEDLRSLFRGRGPGLAAARPLREARRLARAAAVRLAGQGRTRRVRPPGAGPGLLLLAGRACASRGRAFARGRAAGLGARAFRAGQLPGPPNTAGSIRCCCRRRASASPRPRKPGPACPAATPASSRGWPSSFTWSAIR